MLNKILMIALLVGPTLAAAQDVRETPTLNLYAWAERNTSGNVDAKTAVGGGLSATLPIFVGKEALLRGTTDVHVTQAAGTTFDPTNLQTFGTSAEFMFGLERKISYVSVGGKDVRFSARCQGGFFTALDDQPASERYWRAFNCGPAFEVASANDKAALYIGWGMDERGGPLFNSGQIVMNGYVPVLAVGREFSVMLGADAVLNVENPGECSEPVPGFATCSEASKSVRDTLKFYVGMAWGNK
jgi:hypothetical protein